MKNIILVLGILLSLAGCGSYPRPERDVFTLGPDLNEISDRVEKQKTAPDMDMLLRVKLPPNPSRGEVINYINVIYTLSRNQRSYLDSDPQVGMLAKVGSRHIDLLLQASQPGVQWTRYGIEAVNNLVRDNDKAFIIGKLADNYSVARIVHAQGWCREAEQVLATMVGSQSGYLPSEAVRCLAELKNPKHYPLLIHYMVDGWNSHTTYAIIKNLPDIDLSEALPAAWEASRNNNYQIGYLTSDTVALGYMPAFHFLFDTIDDNYGVPHTIYNAEALIKRYTGLIGSKSELKQWYSTNRNRVWFDRNTGKYVVQDAGAAAGAE